jgi:hypothetical protein
MKIIIDIPDMGVFKGRELISYVSAGKSPWIIRLLNIFGLNFGEKVVPLFNPRSVKSRPELFNLLWGIYINGKEVDREKFMKKVPYTGDIYIIHL